MKAWLERKITENLQVVVVFFPILVVAALLAVGLTIFAVFNPGHKLTVWGKEFSYSSPAQNQRVWINTRRIQVYSDVAECSRDKEKFAIRLEEIRDWKIASESHRVSYVGHYGDNVIYSINCAEGDSETMLNLSAASMTRSYVTERMFQDAQMFWSDIAPRNF